MGLVPASCAHARMRPSGSTFMWTATAGQGIRGDHWPTSAGSVLAGAARMTTVVKSVFVSPLSSVTVTEG